MRLRVCGVVLGVLLLLCACGNTAAPPYVTAPQQTVPPLQTTAPALPSDAPVLPKPVTVYPGAVEEFLLPLEEFSWDRKAAPEFVMLHFTSAVVPHPEDPYNMDYIRDIFAEYDLSVHYIVDRDGRVHCYIPEDRVAWHAGAGQWGNDPKYTDNMNAYAIGIEILAMGSRADMADYLTEEDYDALDDSLKGFTDAQYAALRALVADICIRNGIPMDRSHVIGHEEYSPNKSDPGELFDWSRVLP